MAPTPQSLLNRYGQRVLINLAWNDSTVDKSAEGPRELPPPEPRITTGLPPLRENKKPLREQEHQKPARGGNRSGCLDKEGGKDPTLTHIVPEDLRDTSRLLCLFKQAQAQGLIGGSESEQLTFVATAERARLRAIDNPPGLFAELVRRRLWHFVTQDDEDRAHKRLREHFYGGEHEGRRPSVRPPQDTLSKDACFAADISARLRQRGFTGDVFTVVSQELPEWTRERWEKAAQQLSARRREEASGAMGRIGNFALLEQLKMR
jgi:hypothetical protein